jgi:hypothetical protein
MGLAVGRLELGWRLVAQGRMDSLLIVHHAEKVIELLPRVLKTVVFRKVHLLFFECAIGLPFCG